MSEATPSLACMESLAGAIRRQLGLYFPPERWPDLLRGLRLAAQDLGYPDVSVCVREMAGGPLLPGEVAALARRLTVGETYFFREPRSLEALRDHVLMPMLAQRRLGDQRVRIWSAGCCSGEETYSVGILLHQLLPDPAGWESMLLGTDINPAFLEKAAGGLYTEWSFRDMPPGLKQQYFTPAGEGRHEIRPLIKSRVAWACFNLMDDPALSLLAGQRSLDVILCRNVLIYFAPEEARHILRQFHRQLAPEGWLVLSPAEAALADPALFESVSFPGAVLHRKRAVEPRAPAAWLSPATPPAPAPAPPPPPAAAPAEPLAAPPAGAYAARARACADQGSLEEALGWCAKAIVADKLSPDVHYLHALLLRAQEDSDQALQALRRTLYLAPDHVLAHHALAELYRRRGKNREARLYYQNALLLLELLPGEAPLPQADGLTAGTLASMVRASLGQLPPEL